jgi:hypothetical protein
LDALDKKHIIPNSELHRYTICPALTQWGAMEWEIIFSQSNLDLDLSNCLLQVTQLLTEAFPEGFHEGPTLIFTEHSPAAAQAGTIRNRIRLRAKAKLDNYLAMTQMLNQWLLEQDPASTCCGWVSTLPHAAMSPAEIK